MPPLADIEPRSKSRVYDLVREAGVNVDNWANYKGGAEDAARNPKYCYDWAFEEPGKTVVLNLWYEEMDTDGSKIWRDLNPRAWAISERANNRRPGPTPARAVRMDKFMRKAYEQELPIRVIVCSGDRRDRDDAEAKASRVKLRELDPVPWAVTSYDIETGQTILTRAEKPPEFIDQWSLPGQRPKKLEISTTAYARDRKLRDQVLRRANGKCELCNRTGFVTENGSLYLETHHVVPLSENGADDVSNLAALCPGEHREAHFGKRKLIIREMLLDILSKREGS